MTFQNPYWNSYGGVPPGSSWGHFWRTSKFRKTHFSEKGPKFEIKLQISRLQYDLAPKLGLSGVRGPSKFQKISEKSLKKLSEKQNRKKTLVIFGQGPKRALRRVSSSKKSALENPGACVSLHLTTPRCRPHRGFRFFTVFDVFPTFVWQRILS